MEGRARVAHQAAANPPTPANPSSPLHQVISTAMQKTIVVAVTRVKTVPKYKVQIKRTKKFMAHDEAAAASLGDVVRIESCRPLSKRKAWALAEVLRVKTDSVLAALNALVAANYLHEHPRGDNNVRRFTIVRQRGNPRKRDASAA